MIVQNSYKLARTHRHIISIISAKIKSNLRLFGVNYIYSDSDSFTQTLGIAKKTNLLCELSLFLPLSEAASLSVFSIISAKIKSNLHSVQ